MNKNQKVQYAIFAAEKVIYLFENKYPDDGRPRKAIEAAKKYVKNPCKKLKMMLMLLMLLLIIKH